MFCFEFTVISSAIAEAGFVEKNVVNPANSASSALQFIIGLSCRQTERGGAVCSANSLTFFWLCYACICLPLMLDIVQHSVLI